MPKMKSNKSAAKRFKVSGTGKLIRNKAYKSHILTKKSTKRKRGLRQSIVTDMTNEKNMKKILPSVHFYHRTIQSQFGNLLHQRRYLFGVTTHMTRVKQQRYVRSG